MDIGIGNGMALHGRNKYNVNHRAQGTQFAVELITTWSDLVRRFGSRYQTPLILIWRIISSRGICHRKNFLAVSRN
jgi:hypothetical protein